MYNSNQKCPIATNSHTADSNGEKNKIILPPDVVINFSLYDTSELMNARM